MKDLKHGPIRWSSFPGIKIKTVLFLFLTVYFVLSISYITIALINSDANKESLSDDFLFLLEEESHLPQPPSETRLLDRKSYDKCQSDSRGGPAVFRTYEKSGRSFAAIISYYQNIESDWKPFGPGRVTLTEYVFSKQTKAGEIKMAIHDQSIEPINVPSYVVSLTFSKPVTC